MTLQDDPVTLKRWQAAILFALSGFAVGTILSRMTAAVGF